ncbi:17196_t:CDS:1 [Acaulospora morrowiae]|uniref:17196_t:CDS:1 n=1 Tax=Acaulospora morrowiae TaxID=94023 RepID=A0A9N9GY54_9GLOM|nr:17196_t:CDS:1 [Acaulospora morrowiae]
MFSYFEDDTDTLFRCLLVNRVWFEKAAAILWRSPFCQPRKPSRKLIETFISFLDGRSKTILADNGIFPIPSSSRKSPHTFVYSPFVRNLCYRRLYESACSFIFGDVENRKRKTWTEEKRCLLLVEELCKFLIRNCPCIDTLSYDTADVNFYGTDVYMKLPMMPTAKNLFARLRKLDCGGKYEKGELMHAISMHCKNLDTLELNFYEFDMFNSDSRLELKKMSGLICSQKSLHNLIIRGGKFKYLSDFMKPLETQKNSLSRVEFHRVYFRDSGPLEALASCLNLEILTFRDCENLKNETFLPLASVAFTKLRTFTLKNRHQQSFDSLAQMIKNTRGSLREIRFRRRNIKNMVISEVPDIPLNVIETISKACPNLHTFECHIEKQSMLYFQLILNSCALEKLYVSIESECKEFFRSRVPSLLPSSLHHLTISTMNRFTSDDLDRFLKLCSVPLTTFQLTTSPFVDDQCLKVIVKFARRRRTLKYVTLPRCSLVTGEAIRKAREVISFIEKVGEE